MTSEFFLNPYKLYMVWMVVVKALFAKAIDGNWRNHVMSNICLLTRKLLIKEQVMSVPRPFGHCKVWLYPCFLGGCLKPTKWECLKPTKGECFLLEYLKVFLRKVFETVSWESVRNLLKESVWNQLKRPPTPSSNHAKVAHTNACRNHSWARATWILSPGFLSQNVSTILCRWSQAVFISGAKETNQWKAHTVMHQGF